MCVANCLSFAWKMNILGETWSYELLGCLVGDAKSTPKFHYICKLTMLMFPQELIWRGENCYTNILKIRMRSEETLLEKWCISMHFHSVTLTIKADHEAAEHFVCHGGPSTKDSEKWLSLYADWLQSILYCNLLTFGNLRLLISSEVTLGKLPPWQ